MADLNFVSFSGTTRPTAFQLYDDDSDFQTDADKVVYFVQRKLGTPVVDSELDLRQIWSSFEEATIEYSSLINAHHARNVLIDFLGESTGTLSGTENSYPLSNEAAFQRNLTTQWSSEAGVGGPIAWHSSSVTLTTGQNKYDLWSVISASLTGDYANRTVTIRKIHHYEPTAAYRFFDTTSVLNFLGNALHFESYTPETIFYLLPIWEDVLRGTQLQLNQRVRRSQYSFDLKGFELTLYPVPTVGNSGQKIFFEYTIQTSPVDPNIRGHRSLGVVSNLSNIAFGHIGYSNINSIGKTWIWKMTSALSKEILGGIRSKYASLPIPGSDITLNGADLIREGREDQANLRLELKETLSEMSYKTLMAERLELQDIAVQNSKKIPLLIYKSK
jgi:hypothetical protein